MIRTLKYSLGFVIWMALAPVLGIGQAISVGAEATALTCDGKVYMTGSNEFGMLGMGASAPDVNYFTAIPALDSIEAVSAHGQFVLALHQNGRLYNWGSNGSRALGSNQSFLFQPVLRTDLDSVAAIATGNYHSLVLREDSTVWGFGANTYGELGPVPPYHWDTARLFNSLPPVVAIAAGHSFSLALDHKGRIWAWGWNSFGQLGLGHRDTSHHPRMISAPGNFKSLSAYRYTNAIAVDSNGAVWVWGENQQGELGVSPHFRGPYNFKPKQVTGINNAVTAAQGYRFSIALLKSGKVKAWGHYYGLGTGGHQNRFTPAFVPGLDSIQFIEASDASAFAIDSAGKVYAWGANAAGQLGAGPDSLKLTPTEVPLNCVLQLASQNPKAARLSRGSKLSRVYPNPATDFLFIHYPGKAAIRKVELQTVQGKRLKKWFNAPKRIEVSAYSPGLYLLQFTSPTGMPHTQKIWLR
jgi:alpha-tubulin suppressor-like RCC1 family protein